MPVYFNEKLIEPAPFVTLSQKSNQNNDGDRLSSNYTITLNGTLVADKGSPNSAGNFVEPSFAEYASDENINENAKLGAIIKKQGALTKIFSENSNKLLEVQPFNGSAPFKAVVSLSDINFDRGNWVDRCEYVIQLNVAKVWFPNINMDEGSGLIPEQSWSLDLSDEKFGTYKYSHTVSSTQKAKYDQDAKLVQPGWLFAKSVVCQKDGEKYKYLNNPKLDPSESGLVTEPFNLVNHKAYNRTFLASRDESQGKYSITENWILYDPANTEDVPCLEDYTIEEKTDEAGRRRVSVQGTLTGLDNSSGNIPSQTAKYTNAELYWNKLSPKLPAIAGSGINPTPLSTSVGKNKKSGTITFGYDYDDRPVVFPGAKSATITVADTQPGDVFASHVVLGKLNGPILQSINTVTARKRNLVVEIVMKPSVFGGPPVGKPNTDALIAPYRPAGSFKESDNDNWNEVTGRFTRNITWTWVQ